MNRIVPGRRHFQNLPRRAPPAGKPAQLRPPGNYMILKRKKEARHKRRPSPPLWKHLRPCEKGAAHCPRLPLIPGLRAEAPHRPLNPWTWRSWRKRKSKFPRRFPNGREKRKGIIGYRNLSSDMIWQIQHPAGDVPLTGGISHKSFSVASSCCSDPVVLRRRTKHTMSRIRI